MNKIYLYQRKEESKTQTERNFSQNPTINNNTTEKNEYKKKIAIILTISFIIIAILIIVILFVFKPWEKKNGIIKDTIENETLNYENYKKELLFTTKVNDLRRILINQTSYEIMTIDGIESIIKLYRKTYYDIYILSEKNVEEKNNNYFNKIYTASISMVSQCLRKEDEKCDLKEFVDLSISTKSNLRNLKELNDLKDIPVPLCLVNFTDTNIIISISCPESLPENIKNEIFLDLNYFRPMIKASQDKIDEMNLIVSNSKKYLRRKSKGLCDIENEIYSFCDSDINITKSSEGYLVSLQENSFINITNDINNSFTKSKKTSLVDETSNTLSLNKGKYKSILNDFLLKLNPYIKSEENISIENLIKQYNSKLIINKIGYSRSLTQNDDISNNYYTGEETLFYKEIVGAKIYLNLKIDSGINVETSKSLLNLNYDNKENRLVNILQFSNLNKILKKLKSLANSGNYFAYQLYQNIKNNLDNLTKRITIEISNLNSYVVYKDLTEIFDSSLTLDSLKILPKILMEESNNLIDKLNTQLNKIDNEKGEFKNYSYVLENDINNYLEGKYILMNGIFDNHNNLTILLKSPKNQFSGISTYYLNNTSTCYVERIDIENLYIKYNETNYLNNSIEQTLNNFENKYLESIERQRKIIKNLNLKIKNGFYEVENAKKDEYQKIISNLDNTESISDIILNKIKDNIRKIYQKKVEEYKLTDNDKNKFKQRINESNKIQDNSQIIDKSFDKIMNSFKDNFTSIIKYMDKIKEEKITLVDDVLEGGGFNVKDKKNLKNEISNCALEIINKIKNENNDYISLIKDNIDNFIKDNLENLNSAILDLNILLSEESLREISYYYNHAFYSSLNAILNDINYIKSLVNLLYGSFNHTLESALLKIKDSSEFTVISYVKYINKNYYTYHNILKNNINKLRNYINNQLYSDFLDEYKYMIVTIKELLFSIKNNKISDIYPGISQFEFYKEHVNDIDSLNNRIDNYFSLNLFNDVYLPALNDFKINRTEKEFESINNYIDSQNKEIIKSGDLSIDKYDLCINMTTKGKYSSYSSCSKAIYEKYIYETKYSIYSNGNFESRENFEKVAGMINETANYYNSKMSVIKNSLLNIEQDVIKKNIIKGYLTPIEDTINSFLSQKYGEEIVKYSYNYYKNNIEGKVKDILNTIGNKWEEFFDSIEIEINKYIDKFKYSIKEFGIMAEVSMDLYIHNISTQYYNSIINLEKNEFNYTISYYYNFLLGLVNSTFLFIINNIPSNKVMLNTIIDLRKNEVNDMFNNLIKKILKSKSNYLSINNQINILKVEEANFFSINEILNNHIDNISNYSKNKISKISQIDSKKSMDEYSIASKLYLENSELGKQINILFEEIYDKVFIYLNDEKFKEIINNNWIIDQNYIINALNMTLFNSNQEIYNDFLVVKENYTSILEKEINKYYTKGSIIEKINNIYSNGIKSLGTTNSNNYKKNLFSLLDRIYEHFSNESKRINTTAVSYNNDFSKINNTIKEYKEKIYKEIKKMYVEIIDGFRDNLINNFYKEYIEKSLNEYMSKSKEITKDFKNYKLLNSSYNLKEIIDDIIDNLINEYKELVKRQIDYQYNSALTAILRLDSLEEFLGYEIEFEYCSILLPILKQKAIYKPGITGFTEYDLSNSIKEDIDLNFKEKMNNIQKIFLNIKGNNYEVKNQINIINVLGDNIEVPDWVYLNFSNILLKLKDIENYFESFISNEDTYEKNYINETINQIIKSNFNKSLDNIISSFGNDFFERAFKFNEYFRVKDLYNNIEYSLVQTVKYYISKNKDINETNKELPKELKEKMYNLNNIDLIITKNKNSIIGLIKTKIEEFIKYLKDDLINDYIEFMKNDAFISMCFDNSIRQILNTNLNNVKDNLENTYVYILESYLNDKFFDLYRQTIDKETKNILNLINDLRNYLMIEMIDLFKFEPENILEDINNLMIKTLNSINEYNSHLTSFRILDELIEYLNNYGQNNIKPIYDEFKKQLDIISNNQIISNFEKNSKAYENSYDLDAFIKLSNTTYINLKNDYIDNMTSYLNDYYTNFQNIFENKINGENNELININLDESFEKLLLNYDNTKLLIKTLKEFNEFEKTISKNINNINICYKECKKLIENNNYEEENEEIFNKKSEYLKEFSLNYYHQVNESYYKIKLYLNNTLNNMYDDLNKCINITYEELIKEYKKLSEEEPLNEEYRNNEKKPNIETYKFETEDTTYYITTEIKNLESNAKFNMELSFENNDYKKPKLFASIINKSAPKNMVLDIYSLYGYCAKKGITIDNSFNDVTYKMNLLYEPKSSNINVTTFTNFEKFEFTNEIYEYEDSDETDCFVVAYIEFCVNTLKCNNKKIFFNEKKFKDKKEYKETKFIKY